MKNKGLSPFTVGLFQATGLTAYCAFIGWFIFCKAEEIFGPVAVVFDISLFLLLFVVSAMICGFIVFGYPFFLFTKTKKLLVPAKIIGFTTGWLALITVIVFVIYGLM
jgi:hypothetical protein